VAGQERTGDVPMDLVLALLTGQDRDSRIVVGELPPEVRQRVPLGEVERVVGALIRPAGGTVVLEVPGDPREALVRYEAYLFEQDWQRPSLDLRARGIPGPLRNEREAAGVARGTRSRGRP